MDARPERVREAPQQVDAARLSERDARILDFERRWWSRTGAKEEAIRSEFGLAPARYYQLLNAVLDLPAAMVADPMLVKRLQRIRDARTEARAGGAHGSAGATAHP